MQLALNPEGRLTGTADGDADQDLITAFAQGSAQGLLAIAAVRDTSKQDAVWMYWRGSNSTAESEHAKTQHTEPREGQESGGKTVGNPTRARRT